MKRTIKLFFLISIVFFLTTCSQNESSIGIKIDPNREDNASIKDYYKKVNLIPLETSKNSLMFKCDKIIYHSGRFYILDEKQKAVFIFDEEGKFISKIHRPGRGPGEYQLVYDFDINRFTNNLELMSPMGVIYVFDLNGNYKKQFVIPGIKAVNYFKSITEDIVVFYANFEKERLIYYSRKQGKVLKKEHEIPVSIGRNTTLNPQNSPFNEVGGMIYFYEVYSNNIYELSETKESIAYKWDFGKYNIDIYNFPEFQSFDQFVEYIKPRDIVYGFLYNLENQEYIYTFFNISRVSRKALIYNKSNNTYKLFSKFNEGVYYSPRALFDEGMISVVNPPALPTYINKGILDSENNKKLESIKMSDNPIIIQYFYK